jgi:hypothetical protein
MITIVKESYSINIIEPRVLSIVAPLNTLVIQQEGAQGAPGQDANLETDPGWSIVGSYVPRKTIDLSNYTQAQLLELLCTLIDTLKLSKLPSS